MTNRITRRRCLGLMAATPIIAATQAKAATHTVTIQGFAFSPSALTIAAGDTVVFTNADSAPHTATASNGAFDTGRLNNGQSAQLRFGSAGSFSYVCAFHPNMTGSITVT